MSITTVDSPIADLLVLKVTGIVGIAEMRKVIAVHRDGETRLMPIFVDLTEATVDASAVDVASLAGMMAVEMKKGPLGPVALIATSDEVFGLARMYQSYNIASGRRDVGVFRDLSAAERWLETLR
jgi:hypothetical protein